VKTLLTILLILAIVSVSPQRKVHAYQVNKDSIGVTVYSARNGAILFALYDHNGRCPLTKTDFKSDSIFHKYLNIANLKTGNYLLIVNVNSAVIDSTMILIFKPNEK
jgi:hypothetical protein